MSERDFEPVLEPHYRCADVSGAIPIQVGATRVQQGGEQEVLAGDNLRFEWTPHAGLVGSFESRKIRLEAVTLSSENVTFEAEFEVFESGAGGRFWAPNDVGIVHKSGCPLEMMTVDIHVPNLPQLLGSAVGNERVVLYARQEFSYNGWELIMDPILSARDQVKSAKAAVGNVLTHVIRARRQQEGTFERAHLSALLDELYLGLSFSFGDYLGPMLAVVRDRDGQVVFEFLRPTLGFGWRSRFGVAPTRTGIGCMLSCLGRLF